MDWLGVIARVVTEVGEFVMEPFATHVPAKTPMTPSRLSPPLFPPPQRGIAM